MAHMILDILIILVIVGALFPIALSVIFNNTASDCNAFGDSQSVFSTVITGSDPTYDGALRFGGNFGNSMDVYGFYLADKPEWVGKRLVEIEINLSIEGDVTGNLEIGVFQNDQHVYTPRSVFRTLDVTTLTDYPVWTNIVSNGDYVLQSGDIIGIRADDVITLNDITGVHIQINGDVSGFSAWDTNANDGLITGYTNAVGQLTESISSNHEQFIADCNTSQNALTSIAIIVLAFVILVMVKIARTDRD